MREALTLVLLLAGSSCGFDKDGLGTTSALGPGEDGATTGTDETGSPVVPHGDPYPQNAVSFFKRATCPEAWAPFTAAEGRTVVPTSGENPPGTTNGAALKSGEDPTHTHKFTGAFAVSKYDLVAFDGSNDGVGNAGNLPFAGATDPASSGLPYVQLLVCKKTGGRGPKALPTGMQVLFDAPKCPAGFHQNEETQGRVVIGLPKGAGADQAFGAAAMWGAGARMHAHGLDATLETSPHGLLIATGCCRDGYARNGKYTLTTTTEPTASGLPWVELLSCSKD